MEGRDGEVEERVEETERQGLEEAVEESGREAGWKEEEEYGPSEDDEFQSKCPLP